MSEWIVISQSELHKPHRSGNFLRAFCPIHGSDKQRSLSVNEESGFGQCHQCGAQVLVRELNNEAASNIERGQARISNGSIRVRDPKYIARAQAAPKQHRTIETWQQEEITLLRSLQHNMESRIGDERARAYIEGRGLTIETVAALGIGYIPDMPLTGKYARIAKWSDHIVIPVSSPDGLQFAGRCLKHWHPGMDENEHKDILKEKGIDRYRKTHAGGWFNYQALETATRVTVVEGAFDALALIEAGISDTIAIIGTALTVDWLPKHLRHVMLAFDGDGSGIDKSSTAHDTLYEQGYEVTIRHAPSDDMGKDWSERYRLHGREGLLALLPDTATTCILCSAEVENFTPEGVPYCGNHWQGEHSAA